MMIPQFSEIISEITRADIVIDPDGGKEPIGNLCSVSLSHDQAAVLTTDDVARFVFAAAHCFDAKLRTAAQEHRMQLYCWVDLMAGQLRFSVISSRQLPFSCDTRIVEDVHEIATQLLSCQSLDGIPFTELEATDDRQPNVEPQSVDVFVLDLPRVPTIV